MSIPLATVRDRLRSAAALAACGILLNASLADVAAQQGSRSPMTVELRGLEVNAAAAPLGLDDPAPRLSWWYASPGRGVLQESYRVLVASREDLAREGAADVWDSGRVRSSEAAAVYGGPRLKSATRYVWRVQAWMKGGATTGWSEASRFETGLLAAEDWTGYWIAGPERKGPLSRAEGEADDARIRAAGEFCRPVGWLTAGWSASANKNNQGACRELRPAPMLRKGFTIDKPIAHARLYASGLAYADLALNGQPASERVLEPAFTNYAKTVLYATDDVTSLLKPGENVISAVLGSGHFDDAARTWDWGWEYAEWRGTPRLRADLRITYQDGSEQVVATDDTWAVSVDGPTRFDSYYLGETYDARREPRGWRSPGFDCRAWTRARVVDPPAGVLRSEQHEPIRAVARREPGTRSEPRPGVIVYDVGQNLTGWAEIEVEAPAGTAIEIFYTEKIGADGTASIAGNDLVYGQLQTDYYVARGGGRETWTPRFSYKGFQYVQVSAPGVTALAPGVRVSLTRIDEVHTSVEALSTFETSQPTLNRIESNTSWAIRSNLHGIITDTPVYEKNGWTGDAQLTAGTASLLFDTERLYRKMFQDMADAQTPDGEVPLLSPSNRNYGYVGKPSFKPVDCCGATPAWDAFWFVLPWESYLRHGDLRVLQRTYPLMRKYLDEWVPRWTGKDGDAYAHTLTSGLGDWLPPEGVPTINALVSTAFYARMAHIAAETALAVGDAGGAAKYDALFTAVRADFNARFLAPDGVYREKPADGFVQTAQVLPIAFGLVPDAARAALGDRLAADIVSKRNGHAYVGVIGAAYVLPALTATGHHDVAVTVATKTDEPSWGYWTDTLHFTALGESWPADTRSRNHHFFGAIVQWMFEDLAGMRAIEPGYSLVEFKPQLPLSGIDQVSASYASVRGPVAITWKRTPQGIGVRVTVPPNARGRVYLPTADPGAITEQGLGVPVPIEQAEGVTLAGTSAGRVRLDVGSGTYVFVVGRSPFEDRVAPLPDAR